jgi:Amt family ammonium transporter
VCDRHISEDTIWVRCSRANNPTVPVYVAALIGSLTATASFFVTRYKHHLSIDEGLDIFALHGVGGFVGDVLTGFFAADWVPALDGVSTSSPGGWWSHNWKQMGYQLAAATVCASWAFVCISLFPLFLSSVHGDGLEARNPFSTVDYRYTDSKIFQVISCILLFIINRIPGCHIRATEEEELLGLDAKYLYDVEIEALDLRSYDAVSSPARVFQGESNASSVKVVSPPADKEKGDIEKAD